jgi:PPP family 3-phenylpropionic acid transporter
MYATRNMSIARIVALYIPVFMVFGVLLPYMPVWYASVGLTDSQAGYMVTLALMSEMIIAPFVSWYTDRIKRTELIFPIMGILGVFFVILYMNFYELGVGIIALLTVLISLGTGALMPLTEAYGHQAMEHQKIDYGIMRMFGTIAFSISALLCGFLLTKMSFNIILWLLSGLYMIVAIAGFYFPFCPREDSLKTDSKSDMKKDDGSTNCNLVLKAMRYKTILIALVLIQAVHAIYYAFSSLHWQSIGFSGTDIGILWGVGALAECIFFAFSRFFGVRMSLEKVILIGGIGSVLRWIILANNPPFWVCFISQTLHALSFAMVHFATMTYVSNNIPQNMKGTGLSLIYSGVYFCQAVLTVVAAYFFTFYHEKVYYLAAFIAAFGVLIVFWSFLQNNQKHA